MNNGNKNSNSPNYFALFLIVFFLAFAFSSCSGGGSSKKSYAEQYGYSANDFYYKGSNGLWYKK